MSRLKKKTNGFFYLKLAVALIFLINPCIKTFDILPDFISAIIIARLLGRLCDRAPGFSEAKEAFIRLGWLSFMKIPAFIVMAVIRSKDTNDNDIVTLFSFVFAIFEGYLLILAINRLFDALFHVGMRGTESAILPFPVLGKKVLMRPETLRIILFVFAVVRSASYALPEMILLTTSDRLGDVNKIFNAWALYPKILSACVLITLVLGIVCAFLFFKFARSIIKEGSLSSTVDALYGEAERAEIEEHIKAKTLKFRLKLLMISSFFTLDIIFDNTDGIDLLPNFIYGIILFASICLLFKKSNSKRLLQIGVAFFTVASFISYTFVTDFLSVYKYSSLIHKAAKDAFLPVILASGVEFAFLVLSMVLLGMLLYKFALIHTGAESITRLTLEKEKSAKTRATLFALLGSLSGLAKLLCYIFEFCQVISEVNIKGQERIITTGLFPWFNSVSFVITLIFIAYSCYYVSSLCEDIELKYS